MKTLTRESFRSLRETAIVLDEEYQRSVKGGCSSDDHGVGYTDSGGNYHWTRTSECNSNCWSSGSSGSSSGYNSSSGYSSSGYSGSSGYGTGFGGNSGGGSGSGGPSSGYGSASNPLSENDFYFLADAGRWYGGYVQGLGYVGPEATITGTYYGSSSYGSSSYSSSYYGFGSSSGSYNSSYFGYSSSTGYTMGSSTGSNGYGGGSSSPNTNSNSNEGISTSILNDPNSVIEDSTEYIKEQIEILKELEIEGLENYIENLETVQAFLENINQDIEYSIRIDVFDASDDREAGFTYDNITGEIVLGINESFDTWDGLKMLSHELTHLEQLKRGDLWVEDGQIVGHDIHDEVEAFQRQHDLHYGAQSGNMDIFGNAVEGGNYKVTAEDVRQLSEELYGGLSDEKISKPKE